MKKTNNESNNVPEEGNRPFNCKKVKSFFAQNKILSIGIVAVLVAFVLGYLLKGLFIAATVNGVPISRSKVVRQLEKYQGSAALESLVTEELIRQEAKKKGVVVTEEELNAEVKKIEDSLRGQDQTLDEILKLQRMTKKDLTDNLKLNKLIEKILADKVTVTDEEVQSYIDQNKDSFPEGTDMEQVKTLVKEQLTQEKLGTEYQAWIDGIKTTAKINTLVKY